MKIFKTTMAGVIGACLVSFLLTGCGGNGEPSKEKTETKKVVRQKIPEAEKESAAKQKTAQEAAGKPAPASDTTAATKEEKQEPSAEQRPSKKIAGKAAETAAATGVTTEAEKTEKAAGKTEADAQKKVSE